MSRGVNKVILIGNLGKDPETRSLHNGDPVTNLSVATSEIWTDRHGERQERTEWHSVVAFGKLAEIAGKILNKGSKVYLEGQLRTSKYTDSLGSERYKTEIIMSDMQKLSWDEPDV